MTLTSWEMSNKKHNRYIIRYNRFPSPFASSQNDKLDTYQLPPAWKFSEVEMNLVLFLCSNFWSSGEIYRRVIFSFEWWIRYKFTSPFCESQCITYSPEYFFLFLLPIPNHFYEIHSRFYYESMNPSLLHWLRILDLPPRNPVPVVFCLPLDNFVVTLTASQKEILSKMSFHFQIMVVGSWLLH